MKLIKISYPRFTSEGMRLSIEVSCSPERNPSDIEIEKYYKFKDLANSNQHLGAYENANLNIYALEVFCHLPPTEESIMQFKKWIKDIIREVSKISRDFALEDKLSKKFVEELDEFLGKEF